MILSCIDNKEANASCVNEHGVSEGSDEGSGTGNLLLDGKEVAPLNYENSGTSAVSDDTAEKVKQAVCVIYPP